MARTMASITTVSGTTFSAAPPSRMLVWMRTVSHSRKVSRRSPTAFSASAAALRAFTPAWGAVAAWAALP